MLLTVLIDIISIHELKKILHRLDGLYKTAQYVLANVNVH